MKNKVSDPNKTSCGNINSRDHAINTFLKSKPDGVTEISINYTDNIGNIQQQKVGINGNVSDSKITKRSPKSLYKAANKIYEKTCSKSRVSFSGSCSQAQWDGIFGKHNL